MRKRKKTPLGRFTRNGRIDWEMAENLLPIHIAVKEYPFHARVLAEKYGMSTAAVYYRLRQHGVSLKDLRNGVCGKGAEILDKYSISNVTVKLNKSMIQLHNETFDGAKNANGKKKTKKQ